MTPVALVTNKQHVIHVTNRVSRDMARVQSLTQVLPTIEFFAVAEDYVTVSVRAHEGSFHDSSVADLDTKPFAQVALQNLPRAICVHAYFVQLERNIEA